MQLKLSRIDLSFLAPSLPPTSLSFTSPTAVYSPFIFSLPHPSFFYSYSFLFYFTLPSALKNITPWRFRCRLSQKRGTPLPIPNRKYSPRQGERSQSKQKSINVPRPGYTCRYEPVCVCIYIYIYIYIARIIGSKNCGLVLRFSACLCRLHTAHILCCNAQSFERSVRNYITGYKFYILVYPYHFLLLPVPISLFNCKQCYFTF